MKKSIGLILGILFTVSTIFASNGEATKNAFEIDKKASKVHWTGKKVTGEHTGYISISSGNIVVENDKVVGANVAIDLNSIVCTDLTDNEWNKKLVDHLKSDDFFSVEKYPTAKFEITSMKAVKDKSGYEVTGNLTIKGATHPISFPADVKVSAGVVTALGTATIDRTKWNVQYGSGKFFQGLGDKLIYDDFEITFDIQAKSSESGLTKN